MSPDKECFANISQPDLKYYFSGNSASTLSIKVHAYGEANVVPIDVHDTCCLIIESDSM